MNQRGFTLVELLIAMALVGMIMGGVFALQQQGQAAYQFGAARAETQQKARVALERVARELRTASAVTSSANCNIGTNDITFVFVDGAGVSTTVRYYTSGSSLLRNQTAPAIAGQPETVVGDVQTMTVFCYDTAGALTSVAANVRSVDVKLTTQIEDMVGSGTYSPANQHAVMGTRVRMRNL
jgi:prepilin-type N-terminal cleavage/methylation domain-containing protein